MLLFALSANGPISRKQLQIVTRERGKRVRLGCLRTDALVKMEPNGVKETRGQRLIDRSGAGGVVPVTWEENRQYSKLHDGYENTVGAMIAACYHHIGLLRSALFL